MENIITTIIFILFKLALLGLVNQSAINVLKKFIPKEKGKWTKELRTLAINFISLGIAIIEVIYIKIDVLSSFTNSNSIIGYVITGLILAGGTTGIYNLIGKIGELKEKLPDDPEVIIPETIVDDKEIVQDEVLID